MSGLLACSSFIVYDMSVHDKIHGPPGVQVEVDL